MIKEKISHPNQLLEWKSDVIANRPPYSKTVVISSGTCGQASGSVPVIEALKQELLKKNLQNLYTWPSPSFLRLLIFFSCPVVPINHRCC